MMNIFTSSSLSQLVGWSLLHFLWQGTLIAIAVWIIFAIVPSRKSSLRYALGCLGLLAMAICPTATILQMSNSQTGSTRVASGSNQPPTTDHSVASTNPNVDGKVSIKFDPIVQEPTQSVPASNDSVTTGISGPSAVSLDSDRPAASGVINTILESSTRIATSAIPTLTLLWAAGVCLLSLKLIVSWFRVSRVQRSGTLIEDPHLLALFGRLKTQLKMKVSIPLRQSIAVHSPTVIGWLRPVVLMPASAISGLSQPQLSAILVHELAHIRRADYLVNLLQAVIETLLFYHPAVWWLSSRIRHERENCCDDLAVTICGDKRVYVTALLKLEQSRPQSGALALASNGGDLVKRIARMLGNDRKPTRRSSWIAALTAFAIVGSVFAGSAWNPAAVANSIQQENSLDQPTQDDKEVRTIRVLVTAPNGNPLADAALTLGVWYQETANTLDFKTDKNGVAELPVPDGLRIYRLWVSAEGCTPLFANWEEDEIKNGNPPPKKFAFKMIHAVEIGGIIVDENEQPIENVAVEVKGNGGKASPEGRVRLSSSYASNDSVKTDSDGRWSLANIPPGDDVVISLRINHPDYISDDNWGDIQSKHSFGLKELRDKSAKLVMHQGIKVRGTIIDEAGDPIQDALVVWGDSPYWQKGSQEIIANPDGTYETPTQKNGDLRITIIAPGYAPETTKVTVGPDLTETDFVMSAGRRLEVRFVDENGDAVPGAYAQIARWRKVQSLYNNRHPNVRNTRIPIRSDDDGVYVWEWAPKDAVDYDFSARGYLVQRNIKVIAGEDPFTVIMKRPQGLSGTVTDTAGKPIPSFSVIPRLHLNERITYYQRDNLVKGKEGQFSIKLESQDGKYSLLVEADGYETTSTELFQRDQAPGPFNIQMKPSIARTYSVVNETGEPILDATIIVAPTDQTASLGNYFSKQEIERYQTTTTDLQGSFTLSNSKIPRTLLVVSPEYYGEVNDDSSTPASTITVRKWSRLRCYTTKNGQPWQTENYLHENRYNNGHFFHIQHYRHGSSDSDGIFKAKHVAPMPNIIDVFAKGDAGGLRYQIAFTPTPGQEFDLDFTDCPQIQANIKWSGQNAGKVDLAISKFSLRRLEPSVEIPAELVDEIQRNGLETLDSAEVIQWFSDHENWDAMKCFQNCFDIYSGTLRENGDFSVDVLRPGKYELSIAAHAKSKGARSAEPLSEFKRIIEVGTDRVDLGTLTVPVFDDPEPDTMVDDFKFAVRTDQSESSLAKHRGKYVLLDFWTPWCDACEKDTPKVQRLARMLAAKKRTTIISLMANGSGPVVRLPPEVPVGIDWIDGQVSVAQERSIRKRLGVWTSQHFVLIDPNGKYVVGGSFASVVNRMEELGLK